MQEFISTFHIDWKLMIAQLINFGVVFLVFYFLAAKPLRKLMEERGKAISKGLDDAKESSELLQKASEEYKQNTIKLRQVSIDSQKKLEKELSLLRNLTFKLDFGKMGLVDSAGNNHQRDYRRQNAYN